MLCSDLARSEREPLAGTASHAQGCVLLAYPKRLWGRDALESEGLPADVSIELTRLREDRDVITRFVAHEGAWNGRTEISFFPERLRYRDVPLEAAAQLLAAARCSALPARGEAVTASVIAVCTHGQRDRCCALYGVALAQELRARAAAAGSAVAICEASHLGGDRFAPTVLVLPSGHTYGHLELADAAALLAAAAGGAPLLPRFRGSLWLEPLEQLAEVAAFGLPGLGDGLPLLGPIAVTRVGSAQAVLRTTVSCGDDVRALVVRCAMERRRVFGDCRNAERDRRGGVSVWTIEEVSAEALERQSRTVR